VAYTGKRPILPPKSPIQIDPVTGETQKSEYSNFEWESTGQALAGTPLQNHVPGTGMFPHDIAMERRLEGLDDQAPLDEPGEGPRQDPNYFHTIPDMHKGVPASDVMDDPGHPVRVTDYSEYNNYFFDGVPSADVMEEPGLGHQQRSYGDPGVAAGFGATHPDLFDGVPSAKEMQNPGRPEPAAETPGVYGHEHVQEWNGVPSSRVL